MGVLVVRVKVYMYHKMEEKEREKGEVTVGLARWGEEQWDDDADSFPFWSWEADSSNS